MWMCVLELQVRTFAIFLREGKKRIIDKVQVSIGEGAEPSLFFSRIGLIRTILTTAELYFGPGKIFIQYSVTWVNIGRRQLFFRLNPSFTVVIFVSYLKQQNNKAGGA